MPVVESDSPAQSEAHAKFSVNTAAMAGAVGAAMVAPFAMPIILATTIGFLSGKIVGEVTADRKTN